MKEKEIDRILKKNRIRRKKRIRRNVILVGSLAIIATIVGFSNIEFNSNKGIGGEENLSIVKAEETKRNENDIIKNKNHTYKAEKNAVDAKDVRAMLDGNYEGDLKDKKIVFLTFDDGPSNHSKKVLDILKQKEVNGTFFILGENIDKIPDNKEIIKRTAEEGNAIANHSFTHDFKKLYPGNKSNIDAFMGEYYKTEDKLREILGENFKCNLVRFPGGENTRMYYKDPNLSALLGKLKEDNIESIDWNALNGDAEGKKYSSEQMLNYVKTSSKDKDHVIILMHDSATKEKTVEILPEVIDYYKNQGYEFKIIG